MAHTAKTVSRLPETRVEGNSRMYLERIGVDFDQKKEIRMQFGC
jgi:hypothetical protein